MEPKWCKGSAIRYFDTPAGVLKGIDGVEKAKSIPGVEEISFVHDIGETLGEIGSSVDRIGFVIAQGETINDAIEICEKAQSLINIKID
ncbi:hypothetical protein [Ruminococcus flavefaciens]|uniref:hypothetical protein n=1 Tax=Ruminococcus flavefaciens TaxID=1265 RepID=UPI0018AF6A21